MRFPQGRDAAAARQFHCKALLVLERRAGAELSDLENKHTLAQTLYYEATCALHSDDKPGAVAGFRRCLTICKELTTGPKAKIWETDLMLALARCGDHAKAQGSPRRWWRHRPRMNTYMSWPPAATLSPQAPPVVTPCWCSATRPRPSTAYARPRKEAGPTSGASRRIPTSNRSATNRHSKPCCASSDGRGKNGRERVRPRPRRP
jgi:hypothetical protein